MNDSRMTICDGGAGLRFATGQPITGLATYPGAASVRMSPALRDRSQRALTLPVIVAQMGDDGSRPNHARPGEKGMWCGVANRRQIHDCPRNCKRRATPSATAYSQAGRRGKPRPASQETCHQTPLTTGRGAPEGVFDE